MAPRGGTLETAQRAFRDTFVPAHRGRIRVIAADVDGTLTDPEGLLRPVALEALAHLRRQTVPPQLVLVTGRPAAAVQALLLYTGFGHCPIVAENGAVILPRCGARPVVLAPFRAGHGDAVRACLQEAGVQAAPAPDSADRLADLALVPGGAAPPTPATVRRLAGEVEATLASAGPRLGLPPYRVLYSTIHVHVGHAAADKAAALARLLSGAAPALVGTPVAPDGLLCLGDSANDAALFSAYGEQAVAVPGPGPVLHPGLEGLARYAAPAVADEGFAAVLRALFPVP